MKVYKYRANFLDEKTKKRRDAESLINNEFYAARFKELNDPFEGSVELPKSSSDEYWVTPLIQDTYNAGIYSLTKLKNGETFPSNELLWAHYANSHTGFCIEYELDSLTNKNINKDFDIRNTINVAYTDERPEINKPENVFSIQTKIFGTKSLAWNYENEIRIVCRSSGIKKYPEDSVTGVYFGLKICFEERNYIINKMNDRNIKFYQINREGNNYHLSCSELNDSDIYNYKIIRHSCTPVVENYNILYLGVNRDRITMQNLVNEFRRGKQKPANITIYDDIRIDKCIDKGSSNTTEEEKQLLAEHWIAYASFDAPETIWMYPEK